MISLKLKEIAEFCGGEIFGDGETLVSSVTKDSRETPEGSLYIALRGERFDGNDFIKNAYDGGAAAALGEAEYALLKPYVRVKSGKRALLDIAEGYRKKFDIPSVAITGSVGKTTTKEMISSVLSEKFNTLKTEGNFNNEIGMPLTALQLEKYHEIAVFEMGMSHFGEIENMTAVANPDMAVISNIGMSHIGNLGSRENILKAKLEIIKGLKPNGVLAVNGDDELLSKLAIPCVKYGLGSHCDVRGFNITEDKDGCEFETEMCGKVYKVRVNIPGRHNVYNALAAVAVGLHFGVEPEKIVSGIGKAKSVGSRMNIKNIGGIKLISDCYNASPDSMRASFSVLRAEKGRKIAVLADMLEMGDFAEKAHIEIGREASFADAVLTVGNLGKLIAEGAGNAKTVKSFDTNAEACEYLKNFLRPGDTVLVKGSNSMKLFEISEFIEVNFK